MNRLLMIPGPTEVHPRVIQAVCQPAVNHQGEAFAQILDETCQMLQQVFQTENEVMVLPCSGRGGLEAVLNSVPDPDDVVVVPTNGVFGNMLAGIASRLGLKVVKVPHPPGTPLDLTRIEEAVRQHRPRIVGWIHCETSTGMLNPVAEICEIAKRYDALTLVDVVSSLGGAPVKVDEWGIDFCVTASQKALASLAGLSAVSVSAAGMESLRRRSERPRGSYLDLWQWVDRWLPAERGGLLRFGYRRLPWTAATHLVFALREALRLVLEEGLEERLRRHEQVAATLRGALRRAGLRMVPPPGTESPTVTAFYPPEGLAAGQLIRDLRTSYGIEISGGLEELHGKILRVGHMGCTASFPHIMAVLGGLDGLLRKSGVSLPPDWLTETAQG